MVTRQRSVRVVGSDRPWCASVKLAALRFRTVITDVPADVQLTPLKGSPRTIAEWTHHVPARRRGARPYTHESSWLLESAATDPRATSPRPTAAVAFLVHRQRGRGPPVPRPAGRGVPHLHRPGPHRRQGLRPREPAGVRPRRPATAIVDGVAEGWDPAGWRAVATTWPDVMSWLVRPSRPTAIPRRSPAPPSPADVSGARRPASAEHVEGPVELRLGRHQALLEDAARGCCGRSAPTP